MSTVLSLSFIPIISKSIHVCLVKRAGYTLRVDQSSIKMSSLVLFKHVNYYLNATKVFYIESIKKNNTWKCGCIVFIFFFFFLTFKFSFYGFNLCACVEEIRQSVLEKIEYVIKLVSSWVKLRIVRLAPEWMSAVATVRILHKYISTGVV